MPPTAEAARKPYPAQGPYLQGAQTSNLPPWRMGSVCVKICTFRKREKKDMTLLIIPSFKFINTNEIQKANHILQVMSTNGILAKYT